MNIEEARKVAWLKSNPRPLGELLDEGYLTKERLEWAAEWAYNSKLKQAAKVLLESTNHKLPSQVEEKTILPDDKEKDTGIEIEIPLDKARSTSWPFAPYKGQTMGTLVDSQQLSLKDLGYAIETAWDQKVRQAAIALSLVKLKQVVNEPAPSAGFVHVLSGGRSFSARRESWLTLIEGAVLGWSVLIFGVLIWWLLATGLKPKPNAVSITKFTSSPSQFIALAIVVGLFLLIGWAVASIPEQITKRLDKQIEEQRLGQEGEDKVVQLVVQALDGNWHLFRNISLPGRNKADLDLVLVGPSGIWVLEVKNYHGKFRNIGETWEIQLKNKWKATVKNPSKQANTNSLRLKNFLKADHLNVYVNPVVVWASVTSPLSLENPSVPVWYYNRLPDELGNIWQVEKLSRIEQDKIIEKLTKLCASQKKSV